MRVDQQSFVLGRKSYAYDNYSEYGVLPGLK